VLVGSNGIDLSMDYLMKLKIPAKEITSQTNAIVNDAFNKKLNLLQDDQVLLDVSFKGFIDKPRVGVSGRDILKGATVQLIDIAKQELLKQIVILPDTVQTEIEKQKNLIKIPDLKDVHIDEAFRVLKDELNLTPTPAISNPSIAYAD
jgi:hypothetical protein